MDKSVRSAAESDGYKRKGLTLGILQNVNGLTRDAKLAAPGFCGKGQTVPVGDGGPIMRISEALVG